MTHWFPIGFEALAHKTDLLRGYCEAIGRDPGAVERTMATPVVVAATEAEASAILDRLPPERRATMTAGTPEQAADGLRPYIDAGFTGFTFNNNLYSRPGPDRGRGGAAGARGVRILVASYSRTGTTARLAGRATALLGELGHEVVEVAIVPRRELPYPVWLGLSFVPGAAVPLAGRYPDPSAFDACLLAVPKWTLACPPVNRYLDRFGRRLPPTALVLTFGGFDEVRYLRSLERRLHRLGVVHLGALLLKRRTVESGAFEADLRAFVVAAFRWDPGADVRDASTEPDEPVRGQ